jgi:uncharacterized membrane protein
MSAGTTGDGALWGGSIVVGMAANLPGPFDKLSVVFVAVIGTVFLGEWLSSQNSVGCPYCGW